MLWIIITAICSYVIGFIGGAKYLGVQHQILCPLHSHSELVAWGQQYYPDVVPSWFKKQNKTHLISLWYTRPTQPGPLKIYKRG